MKKNFLFKGISILGAVLLFATSVMPTVPVFANAPQPTWYYIHDETSWSVANEDGNPLNKYYEANPYEDLWNPTEDRAANFNDKVYTAEIYTDAEGNTKTGEGSFQATWGETAQKITDTSNNSEYYITMAAEVGNGLLYEMFSDESMETSASRYIKLNSLSYPSCVHNWQGAVDAPGATYPWVIINFPNDFAGTISLTYNGETKTLKERELIVNGYAIASIPTLFGEEYKLDTNGKTSFNPANLTVKVIPMDIVPLTENTDWYYVNNEASWGVAYGDGSNQMPLGRYYKKYPEEDQWNNAENRAVNYNDRIYDGTLGEDEVVGATAAWAADDVQKITINATDYYAGIFYGFDPQSVALFNNVALTESAEKTFNITKISYSDDCGHSWAGSFNAAGAKYPWVVLGQDSQGDNTEKTGKIAFKYNKDVAYPYGDNDKTINGSYWGTASIPTEFGDDNLKTDVNGAGGTFDKSKFSVVLLNNQGEEITLSQAVHQHTVTFDVNGGSAVTNVTQDIDCGGVAINQDTTQEGYIFLGWYLNDEKFDFTTPVTESLTLIGKWEAMSNNGGEIEALEGDYYTGVILKPEEPELEPAEEKSIVVAIASAKSTAEMEGLVELKVYGDYDGDGVIDAGIDKELTGTKVNFVSPRVVRIPVSTTGDVKVKVRHNGETSFTTNGLTTSSTGTCSAGVATPSYNGEPITPNGGYVEIYTCAASTFVAYTETKNPSGGSSGGGSSSYSCKKLPDNATANNTTKPKKDTDYSYSTDTGAVCTFQCNEGYTRNEQASKCEKAETGTEVDTKNGDNTTDVDSTDTSNTTTTEDLQKVLDDGYTVEFHNAYKFAFKNGITTKTSIEDADMRSPLTRIAMAKMLSYYAINVLGKQPDTSRVVPNFPDVSEELDAEYGNAVTLAYQLGIMGINMDNFRPNDRVIRAEFGTALSRMLFGLSDGEGLYYEPHLKKLMSEGIITNDNPNLKETRAYVMIMLMRSAING